MKISTFFFALLMVAAIFFIYAEIVRESNEQFPLDSKLNSSEWEDKYDYVEDINQTAYPLEKKLKVIQDDEAGWFSKLTAGITAVPYVLMLVPQATLGATVFGGKMITDIFTVWNLPKILIVIALLALLIWAIFKLVSFWNKTPV